METKTTNPEKEAIRLTKFWQQLGPNSYPINLDKLIDGVIVNSDFPDQLVVDRQRFDTFEGSLVRTKGKRTWTILLNVNESNVRRQRFTFAHELGHFMCHRELKDKFQDNVESLDNFRDQTETEANTFASWLLMPANLLRDEFQGFAWETKTLQAIGNRFECSLQASALRYVQLSSRPIAFVVSRDGMVVWATKSKSAPYMTSFVSGDELPAESHAIVSQQQDNKDTKRVAVGPVWNNFRSAFESQYFDSTGQGYQYTCIEFQ